MHCRDLTNQAISEGFTDSEAKEKAGAAIGDKNTLLREILNKPELKTWSWRFPKIIFVLGPLSAMVISITTFLILLVSIYSFLPTITEIDPGTNPSLRVKILLEFLSFFNFYLLTPLLAVCIVVWAKQRMVVLFWPIVGIVVLAIFGSGWAYMIDWPTASPREFEDQLGYLNSCQVVVICKTCVELW